MAVQLSSWTPIEVATPRKPEVLKIAAMTGLDRHAVVGWLVEIWGWVGEQSVDGYVDAHVDAIETMLNAPKGFMSAMIAVEWLQVRGEGVVFPGADKWILDGAKSRLKKNLRQKKWRYRVDDDVDAPSASKASTREEKEKDINMARAPRRQSTLTESMDELPRLTQGQVREIYDAYPIRTGWGAASNVIAHALAELRQDRADAFEWMLARVREYAASPAGRGPAVPNPVNWFRDKCYLDDPAVWQLRRGEPLPRAASAPAPARKNAFPEGWGQDEPTKAGVA